MAVKTAYVSLKTNGFTHIINITSEIDQRVRDSGMKDGIVTIFVPGSTGGITTIEYEPGLLKDIPEMLEKVAPSDVPYHHDETWHDGNGSAHVRSALIKTSLTVPFVDKRLTLGTWQQIVFIDFDNRSRNRELVCQIMGE